MYNLLLTEPFTIYGHSENRRERNINLEKEECLKKGEKESKLRKTENNYYSVT
jgi:hypothetical protein